jgi:hypothetical protein
VYCSGRKNRATQPIHRLKRLALVTLYNFSFVQDVGLSKDLNESFRKHLGNTGDTLDVDFSIQVSNVADPDPGSGMGKKSGSGSRIRDEQPGSYFLVLKKHY